MTSVDSLQWSWLLIGVALMTGILRLHDEMFRPRVGIVLTVTALFLVVCWIIVARELRT